MVFRSALSCLTGDCLQLWLCLAAPSKNMHNSAVRGSQGHRGGREMQRIWSIGRENRVQGCRVAYPL